MKIKTKPTPNPNSLIFEVHGTTLIDSGLRAYHSADEVADDALGSALFALPGVHSLMIVPGFVTVTKHPAAKWVPLSDGVEQVIRDFAGH